MSESIGQTNTSESEEERGDGHDADDLDILSNPLDNGDGLTAALNRRPRVKLPSLTVVLLVVVVASAGFIGGIMVGKHYGSSSSGGLASRFGGFAIPGANSSASTGSGASGTGGRTGGGTGGGTGGFPGGTAVGGSGGDAFAGGNATVGTIKLIDGSTIYVQTSAGDIVDVSTSSGTKVTASSTVSVKTLQPGETVIVEGSKNSSGGVSATSISQSSLGAGLGG